MRTIEEQLIYHEGLKLTPYICPAGYWTVGVGRNLESKGLTEEEQQELFGNAGYTKSEAIELLKERPLTKEEALFLLRNDIAECEADLNQFPWFKKLDKVRRNVLIDMRFNLGPGRFRQFKKMLDALAYADYNTAAAEMMDSRWYHQVGHRSKRLVEMMRTGKDN